MNADAAIARIISSYFENYEITACSGKSTYDNFHACVRADWIYGIRATYQPIYSTYECIMAAIDHNNVEAVQLMCPDHNATIYGWYHIIYTIAQKNELMFGDWVHKCVDYNWAAISGAAAVGNIALIHRIGIQNILYNADQAIINNQIDAVKLLLPYIAKYVSMYVAIQHGRIKLMNIMDHTATDWQIGSYITCAARYGQIEALNLLTEWYDNDRLLDTCTTALRYGHDAMVITLWNQNPKKRDALWSVLANHDLRFRLF